MNFKGLRRESRIVQDSNRFSLLFLTFPDSASWKAGVRPGDQILKVNGKPVAGYGHKEVVRLIKFYPSQVTLTLVEFTMSSEVQMLLQLMSSSNDDQDIARLIEFRKSRTESIGRMLCEEQRFLHNLLKDHAFPNEKAGKILTFMSKIQKLEDQLHRVEYDPCFDQVTFKRWSSV